MTNVFRNLFGGVAIAIGLLVAMLALPVSLNAQASYGSIVGTVTDASGAVVPGGTVTITNLGTNEKKSALAGASGEYSFVNLVPANYKVEVNQANFKHYVRQSIEVTVGGTTRIDIALQVGATSETVQVTTEAPLLQTDSGQAGQEVEGKTVQEMPLNGRNTMNLIALAPGVVPQGSTSGGTGMNQPGGNTNSGGWSNYQISGGIAGQSAEYLDGVSQNVIGGNQVALVPTQDAVQEFNVASSAVSAEFGRFSGGVVNMTTKSGSNAWHGSTYEYLRNAAFNANEYFLKGSQLASDEANKPAKWNQNQYGAVIDGPIKRDKAFFLFTWEGYKSRNSAVSPATVPTANLQNGKIAGTVVDPLGKCAIDTTSTPGYSIIPSSCWDSAAKVMKTYWDAPNTNGSGYNYIAAVPLGDDQNQYNARIDYNLSDKQRIFGRYTYWHLQDLSFNQFPDNKINLGNDGVKNDTDEIVLGDTITVNPTTIVDARISWLRQHYSQHPPSTSVNESQFGGTWSTLGSEMGVHMYPSFPQGGAFGGSYGGLYTSFESGPNNEMYYNNYGISASLTKIVGSHSLKLGAELRSLNEETAGSANSGSFAFAGAYTGDDWADFLLGYSSSGGITTSSNVTGYNYYQGYYLQDNWTASRKLTLNLGLRWELPGSIAEAQNRNTVLLPYAVDPNTSVTGTLALVDSPLYGLKTVAKDRLYLLAPRFGFAYRLDNNTAIRGGFGATYLPPDIGGGMMPSGSPINTSSASQFHNPNTFTAGLPTLSSPFTSVAQPAGRSNPAFMEQYLGKAIVGPVPTDPYPYMEQWNLAVSRQVKGDVMVELDYTGSKGTHLPSVGGGGGPNGPAADSDELNSSFWSLGSALDNTNVNINTPNGNYPQTVSLGQSLRPYPFYQGLGDASPTWGATTYHAGTLKVAKRFTSGGILMASYTRSKLIGDTDSAASFLEVKSNASTHSGGAGLVQDFNNHRGERSILSYDTPSRLIASYVLPLPFGQGQKFGANMNGVASRIISGWAVNGITTFQSGYPLTLSEGNHSSLANNYGIGQLRPNYVPTASGCNGNKTVSGSIQSHIAANTPVFNTACFQFPGNYAVGSEPRADSQLRSEGQNNWDLSILKSTTIVEKVNLEFRAEFFNAFNRTQFAPPVPADGQGNFGDVISTANQPRLGQLSLRLNF